jgi:iron complex outermembrane receptor protein
MGTFVVSATLGVVALGADSARAHAQMPERERAAAVRSYEIPGGSVSTALNRLADESGAQIVYDSRLTRSIKTRGLSGRHTLGQALSRLLSGTGLEYEVAADERRVSIVLAQASTGTRTDASGARALPPIDVGAAREQRRVAAGARGPAQGAAAPTGAATVGPPIQNTTAGPVRGYQALTARATRLDTPIQQLPISVQVIPRKVIDDQNAISQSEVFRNVSNVQPLNPLFAGQVGPLIRGMPAERYVDGLPNYYDYGARDLLVNVERVEVLKGPASILFQGGATPVGGVVNVVSKLPTPDRFAEVGVRAGGYRFASPYVDINQPLFENKTLLFRFTGQYETTHSNIETLNRQSFTFNPTIKYAPTEHTSLIVQGFWSKRRQQDYPGLPAVGTIDTRQFSVRRTLFPANAQVPKVDNETSGVTIRGEHKFNEIFSTFGAARFSSSTFVEPAQLYLSNRPFPAAGLFGLPVSSFGYLNATLTEQNSEVAANLNVLAKFDYGPTKNRLLFGGDYNRVWDRGLFLGEFVGQGSLAFPGFVDLANPVFPPYQWPQESPFNTFIKADNTYQNAGGTAQLQSTVFERLHILAAMRVSTVDILSRDYTVIPARTFNTVATRVLPRVGATFDVTNWLAVYGSYSEGLRPIAFFSGASGVAPKPEGSQQWEAGIKLDGIYGLSGTLAYFDLSRTNVPTTPPGSVTQVQNGEWRSEGFEADLVWQPTDNISFLGSYAHVNAKVSKDDNPQLVNSRLVGVPNDSGRLWGNYSFDGQVFDGALKGWSIGAGLYAASGQQIELGYPWVSPTFVGQPWFTRGYVTFDANLAYRHENFTFAVTAKNLGDRQYFVQYPYLSGRVAPGEGRTFFVTVSARM